MLFTNRCLSCQHKEASFKQILFMSIIDVEYYLIRIGRKLLALGGKYWVTNIPWDQRKRFVEYPLIHSETFYEHI